MISSKWARPTYERRRQFIFNRQGPRILQWNRRRLQRSQQGQIMSAETDWQSYPKHPLFSCIQCRSLSASRGRTIANQPMLVREHRSELIASETSCSSMSNAQITNESNGRSEIGFLGWLKDASYFDAEYPPCQIDRCGETA